ncbi:hypothetical protein BXZ70DRAFT_962877 [Cristinia sonorae]|uniref:Uncharacterized protein n=1 Tax=Cristinia sonorae TaxID=1940300 RepID=A0A8K0UCX9_9AGAR|nr:hypothetical protein BXZ70DRAFT_962877 [Cristinia sonorae]
MVYWVFQVSTVLLASLFLFSRRCYNLRHRRMPSRPAISSMRLVFRTAIPFLRVASVAPIFLCCCLMVRSHMNW